MVNILGWYGHNNIGDESYRIVLNKLLIQPTFIDQPDSATGDLILGGGDVLNTPFLENLDLYKLNKKIVLSASATKNSRFNYLHNFDRIYLRDKHSVKLLHDRGIASQYLPDLSFLLSPSPTDGNKLIEDLFKHEKIDLYKRRIGVVINAYLLDPGGDASLARDFLTFNNVISRLAKFMDNTSASFILFPMCTAAPADDRISNAMLASRCKFWNKNITIYERLSVQDTLNLISACDYVISSRLHSTIFSVISGIPFVDICHHDKNKNFTDTIGLKNNVISYWDFSLSEFESKITNADTKEITSAYHHELDLLKKGIKNVPLF